MVSQVVVDVIGVIGGVVLAVCNGPQLLKLWRTKSAGDLSYVFLGLYAVGLFFITIYLYLEAATVGWICEAIETACSVLLITAKLYFDHWGPLSPRGQRAKLAAGLQGGADLEAGGEDSAHDGPGALKKGPSSDGGSATGDDGSSSGRCRAGEGASGKHAAEHGVGEERCSGGGAHGGTLHLRGPALPAVS